MPTRLGAPLRAQRPAPGELNSRGRNAEAHAEESRAMKTILIADDHDHLRLLVSTTLSGPDYRIVEARDGDEACALALVENPDLLILDWMMPGKSGIEVIETLRAEPALRDVPVIMLTARAQNADRNRAATLGVHSYLVKPFSPIELMETVEKILGEGGCK
jgi:CheY-like chemotaxis protein